MDPLVAVVNTSADLSISKIASALTPVIGSDVTFTITLTNNGPSDSTGITVADPIKSNAFTIPSQKSEPFRRRLPGRRRDGVPIPRDPFSEVRRIRQHG